MCKTYLLPLLFIFTSLTSVAQYSEPIDTLSKKEIRRLILSQKDVAPEAYQLMTKHKKSREASLFLLGTASALFISGFVIQEEHAPGDASGILNAFATGTGLIFTLFPAAILASSSTKKYKQSKTTYLKEIKSNHKQHKN